MNTKYYLWAASVRGEQSGAAVKSARPMTPQVHLADPLDCVWNVMAHAQKPDFVFRRNRRIHLNRRGRQFSRLLAAEACVSAVVMLDTPCSEEVWRVLATHAIRHFPLHFPSRASPCAITFQLDSTYNSLYYSNACYRRHNDDMKRRGGFLLARIWRGTPE